MRREIIEFSKIILSVENPRLEVSFCEEEAISKMVADQREKLVELASDIALYGLNPLDSVAVFPSEVYQGYFEVAEGNRRICTLKLLENPGLIGTQYSGLRSKIEQLAENYYVPTELEVVVFEEEQDVRHWMELRHMGEQCGKGLSKWNSVQKMRFQKKQTGSDALLDFWTWMDENKILTFQQIMDVTKTNWQRILREAYFPFLKINFDGKYHVAPKDLQVFADCIREIQRRLAGQTVGIVYDQQRIDEFYNKMSQEMYGLPYSDVVESEKGSDQLHIEEGPMPDTSDTPEENEQDIPSTTPANNIIPDNNAPTDSTGDAPQPPATARDIFNGCKTIIPYSHSVRSSNMRVNKIIHELKELDPDQYPNACGTLLRTLFELSAKVFLEKQTGEDKTAVEFQQAIRSAANQLRGLGRLSNEEHSAILKDIDSLRTIFNGYMHNTDVYPSSMALKNLFKAHVVFLTECLK